MKKNIYFRCIANDKFGLGHSKRIEAISSKLHKIYYPYKILTSYNEDKISLNYYPPPRTNIFQKKLNFFNVPCTKNLIEEANFLLNNLNKNSILIFDFSNRIIINNINIYEKYFIILSQKFDLIIIDSINDECVTNYVNKIIFKKIIIPYEIEKSNVSKIFEGLNYLVFDHKILNLKWNFSKIKKTNVTICIGGSDPYFINFYLSVILKKFIKRSNISFNFILGPLVNNNIKKHVFKIRKIKNINVLSNPKNIYKIFADSSLVITSTGLTKYELACMGVPSVMLVANKKAMENNISFANKKTGMILNKKDNKLKNVNKIKKLLKNKSFLTKFSINGYKTLNKAREDELIKVILK